MARLVIGPRVSSKKERCYSENPPPALEQEEDFLIEVRSSN